jgi:hypothetical protein
VLGKQPHCGHVQLTLGLKAHSPMLAGTAPSYFNSGGTLSSRLAGCTNAEQGERRPSSVLATTSNVMTYACFEEPTISKADALGIPSRT